jgi:uncharacterized protein (DUF362 family)
VAASAAVSFIPSKSPAVPLTAGYSPLNKWPGRCVVNYNRQATKGPVADEKIIKTMVDDSIKLLTGQKTVGQAWQEVFPGLSLQTKIALKINILNVEVPPHPFVVMGIVQGLQQMGLGKDKFPAVNISIYDANNGITFDQAGFTAARFPGITMNHHGSAFKNFGDGAHQNAPYAETLNACDYLINVPGLRGHQPMAGSVTLGFKSHYGTYPPTYHDEALTPPYLRDINCTGPVFKKTALTVLGGIFGLKEGHGPRGSADEFLVYAKTIDPASDNPSPNTVLMSTDPVSAEMQAIKILRLREAKPYSLETMPHYLRASAGITGVLDPTYNIGILDETKMDLRRIINGKIPS